MKVVDEILQQIEYCINNNEFKKLENEKIELKDNSHSGTEWSEVFRSVNAFLNADGGILIIGIREDEKNRKFVFKGFDFRNEDKIKSLVTDNLFTDEYGNRFDVRENITFATRTFLDGQVLIIYVDALADDQKYVFIKSDKESKTTAFKRIITGDHVITLQEIEAQKEYKAELSNSKELRIVPNSSLDDLDVDKLNDYIQLLNREVKVHNIKSSIKDGLSFLNDNGMIREYMPTILGILVCGKKPGVKLHWASEVNAYVDLRSMDSVVQNKKIINGTVIELMEQSVAFVERNIQTGISLEKGGTETFEYPDKLIRECINNSLAHRDYTSNQFVSITIVPGKHIQIRNPGKFKPQLLISDINNPVPVRRIIAGNSKANNPKLAKVLSVFKKWEGIGYGMATVVGACLEDKIDVPYYTFHIDEVSLFIPKGKLVDETMEGLFLSYDGYISQKLKGDEITEDQKKIIAYLYKSEVRNSEDRYTILLTKDNNHLQAIQSLQLAGLIVPHPVSNDMHTVFIVDRALFKTSFYDDLLKIFGNRYNELLKDYKEVLSYIFERNNFSSDRYPSANEVGTRLWIKKGNANKLEGFEAYKRKVRNIVNKLEEGDFLIRHENKPQYIVNANYKAYASKSLL